MAQLEAVLRVQSGWTMLCCTLTLMVPDFADDDLKESGRSARQATLDQLEKAREVCAV